MVGPLRFQPPYTNGLLVVHAIYVPYTNGLLVVHAIYVYLFFIFLVFFFPIFGLKHPDRKKVFFCLVVRGVYPPYTLSGPTKTLFYVRLP